MTESARIGYLRGRQRLEVHMNITLKTALVTAGLVVATQAAAQITFYEGPDFRGRSFNADRPIANLERSGFNDRASSAVVEAGQWQVCEDAGFNGRCAVLRPGEYRSLRDMGLDNQISSVRAVEGRAGYDRDPGRYGIAQDGQQYRRRADERIYEAPVTSVRAVVGPPEQRCWVERQQVVGGDRGPNVGAAIAGAVIGGVLGHQIGSGRGNDVATAGGAVAGAAIGANVDRGGGEVYSRDVQRCTTVQNDARPDYWDVTYNFRGTEHRIQTSAPPGPTITVNGNGEPRV
jgi:uncharacterized protein YcfJ